ncbi:nucleotidyltransferase domain-containing protein [Planococcus liqunii]|uniref:nucleotidyltransferase domain-containing protein n=1 Tax=Planococcus liqunii TaxID=3058394 RepID=UPI002602BD49|nr:nucleotidyltransferase domain-containing protein [Planococcus sp. N056]WKA50886.1 nucleotidyltransferase domain-containing protein [Planococcus sp. N056]
MKNVNEPPRMNQHAKWRLELAQNLSEQLSNFSGVHAVAVGGSVARGYADAYSDLELLVYWNHQPDAENRLAVFNCLNAERRYPQMDIGYDSAYLINGFPVDVWHRTMEQEEAAADKVLDHFSTDLDASNVLDTMKFAIPFYGSDYLQPIKERIDAYPDQLTVKFLEAYLPHFHLRQLLYAARRDNPTAFYSILNSILDGLFLVLLALNRSYFPTYKWFYKRLAELPLVPEQIDFRLRQLYVESPLSAVKQLTAILEETVALAERLYPQVDTAFVRYGLEQPIPQAYKNAFTLGVKAPGDSR